MRRVITIMGTASELVLAWFVINRLSDNVGYVKLF
jgi:hypothetical protein